MAAPGTWIAAYGCVWMAVFLLLLCPPPSFPALVFPNDVLASLDKYNLNSDHKDDRAKEKGSPMELLPTLGSSSRAVASSSSDKSSLPVDPTLLRHSYHSGPAAASVPSNHLWHDGHHHEKLSEDPFSLHHVAGQDPLGDYSDYSDYPDLPPLAHPLRTQESVPAVLSQQSGQDGLLSSGLKALPEDPSEGRHPHSQAEEKGLKGGPEQLEGRGGVLHHDHSRQSRPENEKLCPRCKIRDEDRALRIESLKRKILSSLHFTTLPNRTGMPVPKALAHMSGIHSDLLQDAPYGGVQHQLHEDDDDEYTPPERVFTSAKPLPSHLKKGGKNSCYFTMPAEVFRSRVTKAYLWFYVRHASRHQSSVIQMRVDRLGPPFSKKQRSTKRVMWTQKAFPEKAFGWKKVELTSMVRRWVKHPSSNYGLDIVAMNGEENLAVLPPTAPEFMGYEPMLDIKVTKDGKRRYRRSDSLTCSENTTEHRCCRYPLTVSFAEFGWEWVIAPTHVKADYCSGECRMTLQNKTPYSWIASQTSEGGSCCTPSKMTALPLLYFDQRGDVVFQMLQNMRVERCGCA